MRITRQDVSSTMIKLIVEGDTDDLGPIRQHVINHFRRSVKVPGFRAGKAPDNLVEQHINHQAFLDEFMEHALNELYHRAAEQEKIRPIDAPNVQLKKFVPYSQLEFEAETEILGPIKLPDYKSIRQAKNKIEITASDINEVIKSLQTRLSNRVDSNAPAKDGDEVTIDFIGTNEKGENIKGADGKDYPLVLGSKSFIPGFEDKLIGSKTGDTKSFQVTFPKDYGTAALQNKKVTFKVYIKKVQKLKEPKADDDFAKKAGPFETMAHLKDDIKKQLKIERQQQADSQYNNELIRKIAEKTHIEIPKSLIQSELQHMEDQEKQDLIYRGQTWEQHLSGEGVTEEEHRQKKLPEAVERVKVGLVLSEIAKQEAISVTTEELELRLQLLKGQYQDVQMQAELDKPANRRDIEARLLTEKTIAKLTSYASK